VTTPSAVPGGQLKLSELSESTAENVMTMPLSPVAGKHISHASHASAHASAGGMSNAGRVYNVATGSGLEDFSTATVLPSRCTVENKVMIGSLLVC